MPGPPSRPFRAARDLALLLLAIVWTLVLAGSTRRETTYVYPPWKHCMGMHRVGEMELKLFLGPRARIANPQGIAAVKLAVRDDPNAKGDDDELTLFAVNSDLGQLVYNPSLYSLTSFGSVGAGVNQFHRPRGVAADRAGNVVVADTGNRRLVLLRMGKKDLRWRREIRGEPEPFSPSDVAIAGDKIWVTDFATGRILRFDLEGQFIGEWPLATDSLEGPLALDVVAAKDPWNRPRRFTLVVVDRQGKRLQAFDERGQRRGSLNADSLLSTPARFGYPVIDLHGQVILPDSLGSRLIKLDRRLKILHVMSHLDEDEKPLQHPNSVAIYRRFGQLFIAEAKGGSYVWTGTDILDPQVKRLRRGEEGLVIQYRLTEPSLVSFWLTRGENERELVPERRRPAGPGVEWIPLARIEPGSEYLSVRAVPTYSARKKLRVGKRLALSPALLAAPPSASAVPPAGSTRAEPARAASDGSTLVPLAPPPATADSDSAPDKGDPPASASANAGDRDSAQGKPPRAQPDSLEPAGKQDRWVR